MGISGLEKPRWGLSDLGQKFPFLNSFFTFFCPFSLEYLPAFPKGNLRTTSNPLPRPPPPAKIGLKPDFLGVFLEGKTGNKRRKKGGKEKIPEIPTARRENTGKRAGNHRDKRNFPPVDLEINLIFLSFYIEIKTEEII